MRRTPAATGAPLSRRNATPRPPHDAARKSPDAQHPGDADRQQRPRRRARAHQWSIAPARGPVDRIPLAKKSAKVKPLDAANAATHELRASSIRRGQMPSGNHAPDRPPRRMPNGRPTSAASMRPRSVCRSPSEITPPLTRPNRKSTTCTSGVPLVLEVMHRIVIGRIGEQVEPARLVRQERHDRDQRERRMQPSQIERQPRQRAADRRDRARTPAPSASA